MSGTPPDAGALLPHGPAARFVRDVVALEADSIVMRGSVPPHGPFARDGRAPAVVAVELAAQAAGVLEARQQESTPDGRPDVGYIVGLRELTVHCADIPCGRDLLARVDLDGVARPLTIYRIAVSLDDQPVVSGKISIFTAAPAP